MEGGGHVMNNDDPVLEYHKGTRMSQVAIWVFIASLIAAVGFFLILPAIVTLIVSIVVHGNLSRRTDVSGAGLTSAAIKISAVAVIFGIVVLIILPSPSHMGPAPRSICAANLRGIMQSMAVYAEDNNKAFPIVAFAPYDTVPNAAKGTSTGTKDAEAALRQYYAAPTPQAGSVQACLWVLVLNGQISPKQLVCTSDPFSNRSGVAMTDQGGSYFNNVQNPTQLSYSVAYPWKANGQPGAWWTYTTDESLPLIADMTPLQGTGKPARTLTPARAPADNKTWNSGNHNGDGQNVGFGDCHTEFCRSPNVGHNNDNIYSMSASPSTGPAQFGGIPAGKAAPALTADKAPYDIIMLPVRNETTGGM